MYIPQPTTNNPTLKDVMYNVHSKYSIGIKNSTD